MAFYIRGLMAIIMEWLNGDCTDSIDHAILWAYGQNHSVMSVSLMSFCNYVPYLFFSLFAGSLIDGHNKKTIMLVSDSIAAACSLAVLGFLIAGHLSIWNIYAMNVVIGITNAFQQPASAVAIGRLVQKEKISNASGMNSFSNNLIVVFSPMLAAFLLFLIFQYRL